MSSILLWSKYEHIEELIAEIEVIAVTLESKDRTALLQVHNMFAPTGPLQEISITNGWGKVFLELSERVDNLIALS